MAVLGALALSLALGCMLALPAQAGVIVGGGLQVAQWSQRAEAGEATPNYVGLRPSFGLGSTLGDHLGLTLQVSYLSANSDLRLGEETAALTDFGLQFDVRGQDLVWALEAGSSAAQFLSGGLNSSSSGEDEENKVRRGPYAATQVGISSNGGEVTSDLFLRYEFQSLAFAAEKRKFDAIAVGAAITFRSKMKGILDSVFGG
jgi:hypothetical protein